MVILVILLSGILACQEDQAMERKTGQNGPRTHRAAYTPSTTAVQYRQVYGRVVYCRVCTAGWWVPGSTGRVARRARMTTLDHFCSFCPLLQPRDGSFALIRESN